MIDLAGPRRQFFTFRLAQYLCGIDVLAVREILRHQPMTRIPLAPVMVKGLINLRGQIVTAIDLRRRLALADRDPAELPMNVVIRTDDGAVSLLVDQIGDVLEVDADNYERPPETLSGVARQLVLGVYKLKDNLLLILDTDQTVDLVEKTASANAKAA